MVARHQISASRTARPRAPARSAALTRARLRIVERDVLPIVRVDALPELMEFPDTGCEVSPSCLRCPLPTCIEDEQWRAAARTRALERRDREITMIRHKYNAPVNVLAQAYGLTRRQIYRILSGTRAGAPRAVDRTDGRANARADG